MPKNTFKPRFFRIHTITQRSYFLHVEDALNMTRREDGTPCPRVHVDLYQYRRGSGSSARVHHYLDLLTALKLCLDGLDGHLDRDYEEKFNGGIENGRGLVCRSFRIQEAEGTRNPIRVAIANGPGVRTAQGGVTPKTGADRTTLSILITRQDLADLSLMLLEHVRAWMAASYWQRVTAGTWQPPDDAAPDVDPSTGEIRPDPPDDRDDALIDAAVETLTADPGQGAPAAGESHDARAEFYDLAGPAIQGGQLTAEEVNGFVRAANGDGWPEALRQLRDAIDKAPPPVDFD